MRTEEQIVYDLLNIISGGRVSADDVVSERLVRSFVRKHRASKMDLFFNSGAQIADYVFQDLGNIELKQKDTYEYSANLPALINFQNNFGVKITKERLNIPLLDEESFELSLNNIINKDFPKAKLDGQVLTVFIGKINDCDYDPGSLKENVVSIFNQEAAELDDEPKVYVNVKAVLYDPGEAPKYDWRKNPYPCPSEIIDQIETSTLARDFDLMMRSRSDQADNKSQIDNIEQ